MLVGKSLSPGFWVPEKKDQDGEDDTKAGSDKCVPISCHPGIKIPRFSQFVLFFNQE